MGDHLQPSSDELDAVVAATVDEKLNGSVEAATESAVSAQIPDIVDTVERQLADRFDALEADFRRKSTTFASASCRSNGRLTRKRRLPQPRGVRPHRGTLTGD